MSCNRVRGCQGPVKLPAQCLLHCGYIPPALIDTEQYGMSDDSLMLGTSDQTAASAIKPLQLQKMSAS